MKELLVEIKQYLPKLLDGNEMMIRYFHEGNHEAGIKQLQGVIEGIDWTIKGYASLMSDDAENVIPDINSLLSQINEALAKRDFILVADLFEYEISVVLRLMLENCKKKQIH